MGMTPYGKVLGWGLEVGHVSENSGPPKSSILIGVSIINHPFWGYPYFWKHPHVSLGFMDDYILLHNLLIYKLFKKLTIGSWVLVPKTVRPPKKTCDHFVAKKL